MRKLAGKSAARFVHHREIMKIAAGNNVLFRLERRPHEAVVFPGAGEPLEENQALWHKLHGLISQLP